ncbi:hypothetical protein FR932_20475 [Moritella marina ATCC 15381]|uniref:Porin n=1 Tax=Moritella marina ATCC 15381 TaxID=1202962 RepID=A0A5J6WPC8_MORMI|nr:hypothetical protein [Moritella marina]QFI40023.1 hypothetical protein FR932_20475 [Moritella marina ATCC 15381]
MNTAIKSLALCCAFLPLQTIAAETSTAEASSWNFSVELYGQLTNIDGSTQVGSVDKSLDLSTNDIFSKLKMGGMAHTEGLHSSGWGYSFDYAFMNLDADPVSGLLHQGVLEAKGFKRYDYSFGSIDYMAGIRWWDITLERDGLTNKGHEIGVDWIDYVVGVRYSKQLSQDWRFETLVDAGTGTDTNFTGQVNTGVRYAINEWSELHLAYKAVWVDYDNGNEKGFSGDGVHYGYDTVTHGVVMGWNIKF